MPRPVSLYRPTERLTDIELKTNNRNILPKYNVIYDNFSRYQLIKSGMSEESILLNGKKFNENNIKKCECGHTALKIVLLLGVVHPINIKLVDLIINQPGIISETVKLIVRAHPLQPITKNLKDLLDSKIENWIDGRLENWKGDGYVCVTSSSTASIEAAMAGSGIIWCPFIDDESLMVWPIMNEIGYIAENKSSFYNFVK
jgi:hypothetical protein